MTEPGNAPTLLTYDDAVTLIEKAAEGREDYVNARPRYGDDAGWETCVYLNDDRTPSCIVGTAFADDLAEIGLSPAAENNKVGVGALIEFELKQYRVTLKALRFLESVQTSQDCGMTWGAAIERAKLDWDDADNDDTEAVDNPAEV